MRSMAQKSRIKWKTYERRDYIARCASILARPNADPSLYVHDALERLDHGLDFMEFVNSDGTLISSAQYPARVGYKKTG